ncbi:WD40-repeat-containing domain protein [Gongronella butleri]|nr:WD40-repeat-containing domain protein [Gongronella butleri]
MSDVHEQVQVRLVSKQPKYAVSEAPILVPSTLKRYGLSELVNNLLDPDTPIPFEFLIDNEILRTSLAKYLADQQLSTENIITIEYVESMLPPRMMTAYQHDDWISSVKGFGSFFLTGSYDNMVRLWNSSGECIHTLAGHKEAVKAVALGGNQDGSLTVVSAGLDRSALVWHINDQGASLQYECAGHTKPIEGLAINASLSQFATASADATIKVWTNAPPTEDDNSLDTAHAKKKKRTEKERPTKTVATALEGHVGAVTSIVYDDVDENMLYSGGWDHSIRSWDIEQQVNITTKNCEKVVLAVDYSQHSRLVATGHSDSVIRMWDPRSEDGVNVKQSLRGHQGWVSSVSWAPRSAYTLCSSSYDGTVRVWDIRSKGPVYTMEESDHPKVFAVDWSGNCIVSGGENQKLTIFEAKPLDQSN